MDAEPEDKKSIYTLGLHEGIMVSSYIECIRVAGGWLYVTYEDVGGNIMSSVFVPFSREFMREEGICEH